MGEGWYRAFSLPLEPHERCQCVLPKLDPLVARFVREKRDDVEMSFLVKQGLRLLVACSSNTLLESVLAQLQEIGSVSIAVFLRELEECVGRGEVLGRVFSPTLAATLIEAALSAADDDGTSAAMQVRLRRLLLGLPLRSLDLKSTLSLCRRWQLMDLTIYFQTVAFGDFHTPLLELTRQIWLRVEARRDASETSMTGASQEATALMFPYLMACLNGNAFPLMTALPATQALKVRSDVVTFLLSPGDELGLADPGEFASSPGSRERLRSFVHHVRFPVLALLLLYDSTEFLNVLRHAATLPSSVLQAIDATLRAPLPPPLAFTEATRGGWFVMAAEHRLRAGSAGRPIVPDRELLAYLQDAPLDAGIPASINEHLLCELVRLFETSQVVFDRKDVAEAAASHAFCTLLSSLYASEPVRYLDFLESRFPDRVFDHLMSCRADDTDVRRWFQAGIAKRVKQSPRLTAEAALRFFSDAEEMAMLAVEIHDERERFAFLGQLYAMRPALVTASKSLTEDLLGLLARFEPSELLGFLRVADAYNVDNALRLAEESGARDATVVLLERAGNLREALAILLGPEDEPRGAFRGSRLAEAVAFCERHSGRAHAADYEELWLRVFDFAKAEQARAAPVDSTEVEALVKKMSKHVAQSKLLTHVLERYGEERLGEVRSVLHCALDSYRFQAEAMRAAHRIYGADLQAKTKGLLHDSLRGIRVKSSECQLCGGDLLRPAQAKSQLPSSAPTGVYSNGRSAMADVEEPGNVVVLSCSHAYHETCRRSTIRTSPRHCTACNGHTV